MDNNTARTAIAITSTVCICLMVITYLMSSCEKAVSVQYNRLQESNAVLRANQKNQ